METKLNCDKIEYFSTVYANALTREETAESVVPDTMPDIARLLDTEASIYMRSKTVQDGRLMLEGQIQVSVLYTGEEETGIHRLEIQLPCVFSLENDAFEETDKVVARLRLNGADTRALNPRKILFRAEPVAEVWGYRSSSVDIVTSAEDEGELQTLIKEKKLSFISAVAEKSFVIAEELTLPAAKPAAAQVLSSYIHLSGEESRQVGEKMILQGTAQAVILYLPEDGRSPVQERFSVSFSQILDLPGGDSGSSTVVLMPTAAYIEPLPGSYGANGFSLEIHATAQSVCRAEREIRYIADAYSTKYPCTVNREEQTFAGAVRNLSLRETLRDQIDTMERVKDICGVHLLISLPEMENSTVRIPVSLQALCISEQSQLFSVGKKMALEMALNDTDHAELFFEDALCSDPYVSVTGTGLEFRIPLEVRLRVVEQNALDRVLSVELDTEAPWKTNEMPSITIVPMGSDSLWSLAKEYGSTLELIEAANGERPALGDWLLIPRAR